MNTKDDKVPMPEEKVKTRIMPDDYDDMNDGKPFSPEGGITEKEMEDDVEILNPDINTLDRG